MLYHKIVESGLEEWGHGQGNSLGGLNLYQ